jgi:hypothetical protein
MEIGKARKKCLNHNSPILLHRTVLNPGTNVAIDQEPLKQLQQIIKTVKDVQSIVRLPPSCNRQDVRLLNNRICRIPPKSAVVGKL